MSATAEKSSVVARVDEIVDRLGGEASSLIQVMLYLQAEERWLSREALQRIHERLQVPLSRVLHIATFYKAFSVVPKGRHQVHVCMGTACHVRGAPRILHTIETLTGVRPGETDAEGKLTVETVNCLGCCALGPVVTVDGKTHGNLSTAKTEGVLKGLS
jgi:NADH-quinone oxidoreductase subunit E